MLCTVYQGRRKENHSGEAQGGEVGGGGGGGVEDMHSKL